MDFLVHSHLKEHYGSGWRGRWEGGSGWGRHVNSRTFHFNVWQNSLQIKKIYIQNMIYKVKKIKKIKEHYSVSGNHSQGKSLALNFLPNTRWVFLYVRLFPDKNSLWWTDSVSKVKSKYLRLASKALCNLDPNYYPLLIFKYILLGRKPELLLILCLCLYVFIFLIDCPFCLNPLLLTTTLPFSAHPNLTFM